MKIKLLTLALVAVFFTGCLGSSSGGGTANVALYMTDSGNLATTTTMGLEATTLDEEIAEVWVTIEAVTAKVNGKKVTLFDVPASAGKINLMDLHLKQKLLGTNNIPAGTYSEIRFKLSEVEQDHYIVFSSGRKIALKVPSNELKPDFKLTVTEDTMIELVFDVDQKYFVERGNDGSYNVNPSKGLKFIGSFDDIYGSLQGEVVLPEGIDQLISIQIQLFRSSNSEPFATTSLQGNKLKFEISTLPEGEYWLEAELRFFDLASLELRTDPFVVEAGKRKEVAVWSRSN